MKQIILTIVAFAALGLALPPLPPSPAVDMEKRDPAGEKPVPVTLEAIRANRFPRFLRPAADLPVADQVPAGPPVPVPDPVPDGLPDPFLNSLLNGLLDSVLNGLPDDLPVANPVPVLKETLSVRSLLPLFSSLELTTLPNLLRKSSLCDYFELIWKLKNEVQCCTCNCA